MNKDYRTIGQILEDDLKPFNQLTEILQNPYLNQKDIINYQVSPNYNENYQTFCGT